MQKLLEWKEEKDCAMFTNPRNRISHRFLIHVCLLLPVLFIIPRAMSQDIILSVAGKDFRQAANLGPPVGSIEWINSVLQQNNSVYYEGVSVPQRIILLDFEEDDDSPLNQHSLKFSHQASKGGIHAYDYMTSWSQAKAAGLVIAPPPDDILMDLFTNACGPNIGPQASIAICNSLITSGNSITVDIPGGAADPMGMVNGHDIDASADAYESVFGNRVLTIYGNASFSSASLTFTGYTGGSDKYANYTLTWTSASDQIFIDVAGHLSVGIDNGAGPGIGYGAGLGAAAISGGPYHFKLSTLDDESLGSLDNQIKGADIFIPGCLPGDTDPGGRCDDGLSCTIDTCDDVTGDCIHTPDNSVCNDNNACTDDVCSPVSGCIFTPDDSNACSDGDFCNGLEICDTGNCVAGSDPCNDGIDCTIDSCDEINNICSNSPDNSFCASDGNPCTDEVCVAGVGCTIVNDDSNSCSDGAYCNGLEHCVSGSCVAGSDPCVDGVACTIDVCDEMNDSCSFTPDHSACASDGNPCTDEVCVAGVGCTIVNDNSNNCSDGTYCNGLEHCVSGSCVAGSDPCVDGVICTVDVCDEINDSCSYSPSDVLCDNGVYCDGVETCDPVNGCQTGTSVDCSAFTNQCNLGVCNEAGQNCNAKPKNDYQTCDDGLYCTVSEVCLDGTCGGGTPINCDDAVSCTNDSCNEATNQCVHTPDDALCDNGLYCDGVELCDAIFDCQPGTGDPCDVIAGLICAEALDTCVACSSSAQCDDGNECTTNTCVSNECVTTPVSSGTSCTDDGVACTINACDGAGNCTATTDDTLCVDDGNACTDEVCDLTLGCLPINNNDFCDDGSFCTINDVCALGTCAGTPRSCDDGIACTIDFCNDIDDVCEHTTDNTLCVSDGNPCTDEVCTAGIGCQSISDDSNVCDDGEFCNGDEVCLGGTCQAGVNPCNDNIACTADFCNEVDDLCDYVPNNALCPADGNPCTDEVCAVGVGCTIMADDTNVCDDGEFCNGNEVCSGGSCLPGVNPCVDGVDCTIDTCDELNDVCDYSLDNTQCMDDGNPCTDEVCDPILGCLHLNNVDFCDDGLFCTINDVCTGGVCLGVSRSCDDGIECTIEHCDENVNTCIYIPEDTLCNDTNRCTDDACVVGTGCVFTPDDTNFCDDGKYCNGPEICAGGACQPGSLNCDDLVNCTYDECDEASDQCVYTPDDTLCASDDTFCNGIEICDPVNDCISPGTPCDLSQVCCETSGTCVTECCDNTDCDDSNLCSTDTCVAGVCNYEPVTCTPDGSFCNGDEVCNESTGQCVSSGSPCAAPTGLCCEADDACVAECCSDNDCDDSSHCTTDTCVGGTCVFTPITCPSDGQWCNGDESCNPNVGCISKGSPCEGTGLKCSEATNACVPCLLNAHCDDGDQCTFDVCDENLTCNHLPQCGACCTQEGGCTDGVSPDNCISSDGSFNGIGSSCKGDMDGDGRDDLCVPAVSTWGMVILLLLLLTGLTIRFDRSRTGVELR